jgi:hypothetical protein
MINGICEMYYGKNILKDVTTVLLLLRRNKMQQLLKYLQPTITAILEEGLMYISRVC